jgi:hypothetical protein
MAGHENQVWPGVCSPTGRRATPVGHRAWLQFWPSPFERRFGRKKVAHFVWANGTLRTNPYKFVPPQPLLNTGTLACNHLTQRPSVDICEGEGHDESRANCPNTSSLPDRESSMADSDMLPGVHAFQTGVSHPRAGACHRAAVPRPWPKSGSLWRPAPMGSVDCWPLASHHCQIPGGKPSAEAAVRQRVCGWYPPPGWRMSQRISARFGRP